MELYDDDDIQCCAVSSDGSLFVCGGTSSLVKVFEFSKDKKIDIKLKATLDGHLDTITTIRFFFLLLVIIY